MNEGDRLLPITVEEESPFPTLDEVEQMSNQQIKIVHSNRELPKIDNPMWKTGSDEVPVQSEQSMETKLKPIDRASDAVSTDVLNDDSSAVTEVTKNYIGHKIPEDLLRKAGLLGNADTDAAAHVEPIYKLNDDGSICSEYQSI